MTTGGWLRFHGEGVDTLTVRAELDRRGDLKRAGGEVALASLTEHAAILVHLPSYERLVAEAARRRDFLGLGERLRSRRTAGGARP